MQINTSSLNTSIAQLKAISVKINEYWPIKPHQCVYISSHWINGEDGASSFPGQSVLDHIVSMVHVCVELQ